VKVTKTVADVDVTGPAAATVSYTIVVENQGGASASYTLDDVTGFDDDVAAGPLTIARTGGTSTTDELGTALPIAGTVEALTTDVYTVTVPVTVDLTEGDGEYSPCDGELPESGQGLFNTAILTVAGEDVESSTCDDVPVVDIDKTAATPTKVGDGIFDVTYTITVSNVGGAATGYTVDDTFGFSDAVVTIGAPVLDRTGGTSTSAEDPSELPFNGIVEAGSTDIFSVTQRVQVVVTPTAEYEPCSSSTGEEGEGLYNLASVQVGDGSTDDDVCVDVPGDLKIQKSDGNATAIAGGAPFSYTLTVTNVGGISTGEPVTVTDVLPTGFVWNTPNEDPGSRCDVPVGQTITCTLPAGAVDAAGESSSITLSAKAPATTAANAAGLENLSFVDSPLDPAPEEPDCDSTSNNVDCELTPVDTSSDIEVSKTDDVADGATVEVGDQYTYDIVVTNVGPSQVTDVAISDDLPAGLTLVSVSEGVGWDECTITGALADDPVIACAWQGALAAGADTTAIEVTVLVENQSFPNDTIVNPVDASAKVVTIAGTVTLTADDEEQTPLERTIDVTGFLPDCLADFPVIEYTILEEGFVWDGSPIELALFDKDGNPVIETPDGFRVGDPGDDPYIIVVDSLSGTIPFPGSSQSPPDWPGWLLDDGGFWVIDPSDAFLRDGVILEVSVNPTATTGLIEYPSATDGCANPPTDFSIEKDDAGAQPLPGETFTYTLTVTNLGGPAEGPATVTDVLPAEFEWTEVGACTQDGQVVTCTLDPPPPASAGAGLPPVPVTIELEATVRPGTAVTDLETSDGYVNLAYVDHPDDPVCPDEAENGCEVVCPEIDQEIDSEQELQLLDVPCVELPTCETDSNNVACEPTPVDGDATLVVTKDDSVGSEDTVVPGESFTYTITVANSAESPSPVYDVELSDPLPAGLTATSTPTGTDWDCSASTTTNVSCTYGGGALDPGEAAPAVTVPVKVAADYDLTVIDNVATGTAVVDTLEGPKDIDDTGQVRTPLEPSIDVGLFTETCINDTPYIDVIVNTIGGFQPTLVDGKATVTLRMFGDQDGNGVFDTFIEEQVLQIAPNAQGNLVGRALYPGAEVDANGDPIDWPGWIFTGGLWQIDPTDDFYRDGLRIEVSINPTGEVSVEYPPATPECNANPEQVSADLAIVKQASVATADRGGQFDWILTIGNNGPDAATNVVVSDTIPAPFVVQSIEQGSFSCTRSGNAITCTRATMAVGETLAIKVRVATPVDAAQGVVVNTGSVQAVTPDPNLANNSASASVTIPAAAVQPPAPNPLPATGAGFAETGARIAAIVLGAGLIVLAAARRRRYGSLN
jgi:uncharacterized repeat protein (TIGR01451 family)